MKKFLLKSLLVAVGLLTGGNAWGEVTTLYERGTTNAWAASDVGDGEWSAGTITEGLAAAGGQLSHTVNNSAYTVTKTISPTSNYVVSMTATAIMGRTGRNGAYNFVTIGGAQLRVDGQSWTAQVFIDGVAQGTTVSATRDASYTFNVSINQKTGNVTYSVSGGATIASTTTSTSTAISSVSFGYVKNGSVGNINTTLTSINITEEPSASTATVTYKYEDTSGTDLSSLKADVEKSEDVGSNISDLITSALNASFYNGDNSIRYDYSTFTCSDATVPAGGTTVTLKFAPKARFTYNVYAVNGSSVKLQEDPIATKTAYAGETATLTWSKYIKIDGTWYSTSESTFSTTATEAGSRNVVYTSTDITYFFEIEDLTANRGNQVQKTGNNYSGGITQRHYGADKGRTSHYYTPALNGGIYTVSIPVEMVNVSGTELSLRTRTAGGFVSDPIVTETFNTNKTYTFEGIEIPEGSSLVIYSANEFNSNALMDYVTLTLTGVSATIGTKDYTTFASPYPLDCASLPDGLTAYYVEASKIDKTNSVVTLTKVTEAVAAGTGLLLKGTANQSYNITVAASGTDLSSTNKMVGCTASTDITKSTANYANFYVMVNGETEPEFQNLKNYLDSHDKVTIPAGKAYLDATGVADVRSLKIAFEDAETGINEVNAPEAAANGCFNLAGQRVANPTKGLYIVNGKKVLVK